ncbi:MAG TPA: CDP-alcohol phosphatidyltransferase family protein [Candidatus Bariatricus faecipullorum]|nr:CDP-alcohol phosphatidyltransferase family protein [Candidatus Bariatricus faecipullorum]
MKITKKDLFTIPNLMGYFRILMIPVFGWLYMDGQNLPAVVVLAVSEITDMLDGQVARRFHMVTDFGKMLDPVADKLTQAAVAVCLAVRYPLMWVLIGLMVIKEGYMALKGLQRIRAGKEVQGAKIYGKVCTVYLFVMMAVLVAFPQIPVRVVYALIFIALFLMTQTLVLYMFFFRQAK